MVKPFLISRKGRLTKKGRRFMRQISDAAASRSLARSRAVTTTPNQGMPRKLKVKMPYHQWGLNVNPTSGTASDYIFSAGGLYDPNVTGAGHSPRAFDQIMELYDHYVVIAAKITVDWFVPSGEALSLAIVCNDTSSPMVNPDDVIESRYVKSAALLDRGAGTVSTKRLSLACNPPKFLGISKPCSSDKIEGTSTSNPTDTCFFHVISWGPDGGDPPQHDINVHMEFVVIFKEPKLPTQS